MTRFLGGMRGLALLGVWCMASVAYAHPAPPPPPPNNVEATTCELCPRAEALLDELGEAGAVLRGALPRLATLARSGAAVTGVLSDAEHDALATAVAQFGQATLVELGAFACRADEDNCSVQVANVLRCEALGNCGEQDHRQQVNALPSSMPRPGCDAYVDRKRFPKLGMGPEIATGWQDSAFPNEHRAWSFGFELRRRLTHRFAVMTRIDRTTGRDEGIDTDGDGQDDVGTGKVTRVSALAGPSIVLTDAIVDGLPRYLELDLLGGYTAMTSPGNENGVMAGADLSYQLVAARVGVRALQGFGDAHDARAVLAHFAIVVGSWPSYEVPGGCDYVENTSYTSGVALSIDLPLSGYSGGTGIGYMMPGFALEGAYNIHPHFQALFRGDLLLFLNGDADHIVQQSLFAGGRIDLSPTDKQGRVGPFIALLAGYGWGAATKPTRAGSGPVIDASIGYMYQESDGAMWARLHGRFGMTPDNEDIRAVFFSLGLELRLDRRRWRKPD